MTNPEKVVCSSNDYLLSLSDDPNILFITRRDEKEFNEDYSYIATDMFHTYLFMCMIQSDEACPIISNYSFALTEDKKAIRIEIVSQEELHNEESQDDLKSSDSEDDNIPTAEEIAELIERKRKEKTFWYKLKKLFGL